MVVWAIGLGLTALVVYVVLRPLGQTAVAQDVDHETAVYADQLREIEQDLERELISDEQADDGRRELARRLAARQAAPANTGASGSVGTHRRLLTLIGLVSIPLITLAVYVTNGSPRVPGAPLYSRVAEVEQAKEAQDYEAAIASLEKIMAEQPDQPEGWRLLGQGYSNLGRIDDAVVAYRRATVLDDAHAAGWADFGEILFIALRGEVSPEGRAAFETARALDAEAPKPHYYLAIGDLHQGKYKDAIAGFELLLAKQGLGEPLREVINKHLTQARAGLADPASVDAAQTEGAAENDMIRGMVTGLAERLASEPDDLDGWLRLIRSYRVLQDPEKATEALARAKQHFADDAAAVTRLEAELNN
jgi:cytochrome c-type biogenesis protein CcmH